MKKTFPSVSQLRQLPVHLAMTIPAEWEDRNGHVNVQFYQALYELGGWEVLGEVGIDEDWLTRNHYSMFDLEHHLHYRSELNVGDEVSTYGRVLAHSDRRFHGMYFIVNETRGRLAATLEYVTAGVDMRARRTAAFPDRLVQALETQLEEHRKLDWAAPVCGLMSP
jgi:acyl-CoA thioester hydrolase